MSTSASHKQSWIPRCRDCKWISLISCVNRRMKRAKKKKEKKRRSAWSRGARRERIPARFSARRALPLIKYSKSPLIRSPRAGAIQPWRLESASGRNPDRFGSPRLRQMKAAALACKYAHSCARDSASEYERANKFFRVGRAQRTLDV